MCLSLLNLQSFIGFLSNLCFLLSSTLILLLTTRLVNFVSTFPTPPAANSNVLPLNGSPTFLEWIVLNSTLSWRHRSSRSVVMKWRFLGL